MNRTETIMIIGFYIFLMSAFALVEWGILWRFVKDQGAILTIHKIDWEDRKEIKFHKLEEDHVYIMAMEIFATNDVYMIGLINTLKAA